MYAIFGSVIFNFVPLIFGLFLLLTNTLKKIIQYNKDDFFATLQIAEYLIKNQLKKNAI